MNSITSSKAPSALGPYSQAMQSGNFLFLSGQLGIDPATGKLAGDDTNTQTLQVFENIKAILATLNGSLSNVVKSTMFLADISEFALVNELYATAFGSHKPARSTVQVAKLPLNARIEIECIAEIKA